MDKSSERWRPYPGFAGFYEISDQGNVYSLARATTPGGLLKPYINRWGYRTVNLSKYGRTYYRRVGRMVLEAWVSECPPGHEACHGPGGPLDDSLPNLSWGTKAKNHGPDRVRDGTSNRGENCAVAKLTAEIVIECRQRYAAGETQTALAAEFGVNQAVMSRAIRGITWADLAVETKPVTWTPLTEEVVLECRRRYAAGETQSALATEFGVYYGAMNRAIRGATWADLPGAADPETDGRSRATPASMREQRREYGRKGAKARWG